MNAVAETDPQVAVATAANSLAILELSGLPLSLQIGEKMKIHQGRAAIE